MTILFKLSCLNSFLFEKQHNGDFPLPFLFCYSEMEILGSITTLKTGSIHLFHSLVAYLLHVWCVHALICNGATWCFSWPFVHIVSLWPKFDSSIRVANIHFNIIYRPAILAWPLKFGCAVSFSSASPGRRIYKSYPVTVIYSANRFRIQQNVKFTNHIPIEFGDTVPS